MSKQIVVKGEPWKIEISKELRDINGAECDGLCDYATKTIFLDSALRGSARMESLLHEVCHAVLHESHLEFDSKLDEAIAGNMASALVKIYQFKLK